MKPTYTIELDYSELVHACDVLTKRFDHVNERLLKNPTTPNWRHLEKERDALQATIEQMADRIRAHAERVRASLRSGQGVPGELQ
jgi:phosphoribosylaminoimidazole carboxylase (NCAIR synthetase)